MSDHYCQSDYKDWERAGLKDFGLYAECVEYINQSEYGDGQLEGEWWYADDDKMTIYNGTFGNFNSPGVSHYTYAEVYDDQIEFLRAVLHLEGMPEYLDSEPEPEPEEEDEDAYAECEGCGRELSVDTDGWLCPDCVSVQGGEG